MLSAVGNDRLTCEYFFQRSPSAGTGGGAISNRLFVVGIGYNILSYTCASSTVNKITLQITDTPKYSRGK